MEIASFFISIAYSLVISLAIANILNLEMTKSMKIFSFLYENGVNHFKQSRN